MKEGGVRKEKEEKVENIFEKCLQKPKIVSNFATANEKDLQQLNAEKTIGCG